MAQKVQTIQTAEESVQGCAAVYDEMADKQTVDTTGRLQQGWNRVFYVPCNRNIARDFFARISRVDEQRGRAYNSFAFWYLDK